MLAAFVRALLDIRKDAADDGLPGRRHSVEGLDEVRGNGPTRVG